MNHARPALRASYDVTGSQKGPEAGLRHAIGEERTPGDEAIAPHDRMARAGAAAAWAWLDRSPGIDNDR